MHAINGVKILAVNDKFTGAAIVLSAYYVQDTISHISSALYHLIFIKTLQNGYYYPVYR